MILKMSIAYHSLCSSIYLRALPLTRLAAMLPQKDTSEPFDLDEVLQELPKGQREALWARLVTLLCDQLAAFAPEHWDAGLEEDNDMEVVSQDRVSRVVTILHLRDTVLMLGKKCVMLSPKVNCLFSQAIVHTI